MRNFSLLKLEKKTFLFFSKNRKVEKFFALNLLYQVNTNP